MKQPQRIPALLGLLLLPAAALAEPKVVLPPGKDGTIDNLVRVVVPSARSAAVSDAHGLLAFTHHPRPGGPQVSLCRLDRDGKPEEKPATLALPSPNGLGALPTVALSLAFHPKLPLLYVWQDVVLSKDKGNNIIPLTAAEEAAANQLDHLFIYRLDKGEAKLLVGLCRGEKFGRGAPAGDVGIDPDHGRLYIPNIRPNAKQRILVVGSFVLDRQGLPLPGKEGSDDDTSLEARVKAINDLKNDGKPILPQRVAPLTGEAFPDLPSGCGFGYVPIAKDVVLFGGYHDVALITWAPDDRRTKLTVYQGDGGYRCYYPVMHPSLPVVYSAFMNAPWLFRFDMADGFPAMVPTHIELRGAEFFSPPLIVRKTGELVFGGRDRVFAIKLDDKGRLTDERRQMVVGSQRVEAVAYSEKYDRLYVGVEKLK